MPSIRHLLTLDYYDIPILWIGIDNQERRYICLNVESSPQFDTFFVVEVPAQRIVDYMVKKIDLRNLLSTQRGDLFYRAEINDLNEEMTLTYVNKNESWFPDPGYFFDLDESSNIVNSISGGFVSECLKGRLMDDDIYDFIRRWGEGNKKETLHDALGMSYFEYQLWLAHSGVLNDIFNARNRNSNILEYICGSSSLPIAARSEDDEEVSELLSWLRDNDLWS